MRSYKQIQIKYNLTQIKNVFIGPPSIEMDLNWEKTAKLNGITVNESYNYFGNYPLSNLEVIRICKNCRNEDRVSFHNSALLCKKCSAIINSHNYWYGINRSIAIDRAKEFINEVWKDPERREVARIRNIGDKNPMSDRIGDSNPMWKGGISFGKYCPLFNESLKRSVRNFYNNRCFLCGKTKDENGCNLPIHHVNYDKDCLCHSSCEFVPLCQKCHGKTGHNRQYWEDLIMHYLYPNRFFMVEI